MNIYFSGLGGVGIGPLAEIALDAGHNVTGSDANTGLMTEHLATRGVVVSTDQSGDFLKQSHANKRIDWFVYTAALPPDHPELTMARELNLKISKRDELLAHIIDEKGLKLIAIAGTHGKTTTTGMMIWALKQLGIPVSYSIGTTLSWGPSGLYDPESKYFVYECDEFDRNFLHFKPYISIVTTVEHDHIDTYPTESDYYQAFSQFAAQSYQVISWQSEVKDIDVPSNAWVLGNDEIQNINLAGEHNRKNATLVAKAIEFLAHSDSETSVDWNESISEDNVSEGRIHKILASFPGTNRRFEKLADNLYTDYGHTPTEITATLQMARELSDHVILVYQPHQNVRQHEIRDQYVDSIFADAEEIYWLPTYMSRERENLKELTPDELIKNLDATKTHIAMFDDELWHLIEQSRAGGKLVLAMGAGSIDGWVRQMLADSYQN